MKVYLATDHAGFELKEKIKSWLSENKYDVEDFGAHSLDLTDDYPDYISQAAKAVSKHPENRAIVLGGSGQGEAMVSDRYDHVRTALYYGGDMEVVRLSRLHNDANILSLGARFLTEDEALRAVKLWLETPFSNEERHKRRIEKF